MKKSMMEKVKKTVSDVRNRLKKNLIVFLCRTTLFLHYLRHFLTLQGIRYEAWAFNKCKYILTLPTKEAECPVSGRFANNISLYLMGIWALERRRNPALLSSRMTCPCHDRQLPRLLRNAKAPIGTDKGRFTPLWVPLDIHCTIPNNRSTNVRLVFVTAGAWKQRDGATGHMSWCYIQFSNF